VKAGKPEGRSNLSKSLWHHFNRLVSYDHISNCLRMKERALRSSNTFQLLTTSALAPKGVENVDTPNDLSPRQNAEKWELFRGKGGTKNREEGTKWEDTESPCSGGRKEWGHKTASLIARSQQQFRSRSLLSSPQAGWCQGSVNKRSRMCLCLCTNAHACIGSEDSQGELSSHPHPAPSYTTQLWDCCMARGKPHRLGGGCSYVKRLFPFPPVTSWV